jgi:hypothetical protein
VDEAFSSGDEDPKNRWRTTVVVVAKLGPTGDLVILTVYTE